MSEKSDKAAIWDVDGTMVDTAELHFRSWKEVCREKDCDFTRDDFKATFGKRNPDIIRALFGDRFSQEEIDALGDHKEDLYRQQASKGVDLLPGVRKLVEDLHRAGFAQAIGSSAPHANLELILRLTGIGSFFDAMVGSEDTQRGKPDPQVFLLSAQRLGVSPPRCVVFEDAVAGVQAAHTGGMKSVAVLLIGHHSEDSLRQAGADLVVDSLEKVSADTIRGLLAE